MQYALLIYGDESQMPDPASEVGQKMFNDYFAFDQALAAAGTKLGGEALHGTESATTVRVRDGETLTTDGPFAETREQLGGFYLIEADDLDAAIKVAADLPGSWYGSVEIRPVMSFG